MRSQKCIQCGTLLDVSKLEKGARFACANCGSILVVGDVAVKKSLQDSGPAFKPRGEKGAVVEAPRRPKRTPESRERPERAPAKKSSAMPLLIGIGAVVVVGVVVAIVLSSGKDGPQSGPGGTGPTAASWWQEISAVIGAADARELKAYLAQAKSQGYDRDPVFWRPRADELYRALLAKAPADEEANRHFGRKSLKALPDLTEAWNSMEEHLKVLPDEYKSFQKRYEDAMFNNKVVWLDAGEFAREQAVLTSFRRWRDNLKQDPSAELLDRGKTRALAELKGYDAAGISARPFLLFFGFKTEGAEVDARVKELEKKAGTFRPALELLMRTFEERFRGPLKLPEFESDKGLYVWVFDTLPAYQEFVHQRPGFGPGSDVNAFFSPKVRWVYAGLSDDATISGYLGRDLTHTAVHQLQWHFSKEKWDNYFEEWNGLWFTVGFAAYLGGGIKTDGSGRAKFTGIDSRRVETLQRMKDNGIPFPPLRELAQIDSLEGFGRWWRDTWSPQLFGNEDLPDTAREVIGSIPGFPTKMLYGQAWYLAYFMNEYEGGKYRQKYLDLLMTALRGKRKLPQYGGSGKQDRWKSSFDAFAGIMGLKTDEDWKRLQREHDGFLSQALNN